jgi:hypothetical protein
MYVCLAPQHLLYEIDLLRVGSPQGLREWFRFVFNMY